MFTDASLALSTLQALTSTTTTSTVVYDVTGAGVGVAPNMIGGLVSTGATLIGSDIGAGDGATRPTLYVDVTTAAVSAGGATLQIQIQAAPDTGSNTEGTYVTLAETGVLTVAQLTAGAPFELVIPPVAPTIFGEAMPRFYRVRYVIATSTFSALTLNANIVLNPQESYRIRNYPRNYVTKFS